MAPSWIDTSSQLNRSTGEIEREQIHVGDKVLLDHLDAYSAPRLVEYFDENPCELRRLDGTCVAGGVPLAAVRSLAERARSLGVTIEAQYWLRGNGYRIPTGAASVLGNYIRQNMRFFVAKVNLKEQSKLGFSYLRPSQVAYDSPKFMLPIRLGMVSAHGPQELFVYALTRRGRVETTNYRTVKLATLPSTKRCFRSRCGVRAWARSSSSMHGTRVGAIHALQIRCPPMNCAALASFGSVMGRQQHHAVH